MNEKQFDYTLNNSQQYIHSDVIEYLKRLLGIITLIAICGEVLLFPSLDNLLGCSMMLIVYLIYNSFVKDRIIVDHPFSFFMYTVAFLYRYLPVPCTLLELKPVSYGMEMAFTTFTLETFAFIVITVAFDLSIRIKIDRGILPKIFRTFGVYGEISDGVIWMFGIVGALAKIIYLFQFGVGKTGTIMDTSARMLTSLEVFEYAPLILFFPCLYRGGERYNFKKKSVWIYVLVMCVINLANNSRGSIVQYFVAALFFWFIAIIRNGVSVKSLFTPKRMLSYLLILIVAGNLLTVVSDAMLLVRSVRGNYSASELIQLTARSMFYADEVENIVTKEKKDTSLSYLYGWTEDYVDNFILNRFCNIRITDETLYYGTYITRNEKQLMQENFKDKLISLVPSSIQSFLGVSFDKTASSFSRGDYLYYLSGYGNKYSLGGQRVTSNVGDGMATWGVFYFLIELVCSFLIMKVSDLFVYVNRYGEKVYSLLGLLLLWSFTQIFCNNSGVLSIFNFLLRGFWENILMYMVLFMASFLLFKREK